MSRWHELFEDSTGRLSQSRLITFIVFVVGGAVIIALAIMKLLTAGIFATWIGGGGATYGTGKISDLFDKGDQKE